MYGVTMPLVVSESGDKFGKSSGTPVWINELKTTPYEVGIILIVCLATL